MQQIWQQVHYGKNIVMLIVANKFAVSLVLLLLATLLHVSASPALETHV